MAKSTTAQRSAHVILALVAIALPTLSLLPLGGLYLWEKGYLLMWALSALVCIGLVYALQWTMLRKAKARSAVIEPAARGANTYTGKEKAAWIDVRALAATVDPASIDSSEAAFDLAIRTIGTVAKTLHPEHRNPEWNFTLPEALAISERVSRRLSTFIVDTVPFGDRMTVAQFLTLYRARRAIDLADKAYDVWRIVRLINPATAATNEARERLTRAIFSWGKDHVTRRLAETYVEEVGRAAIDLYSGRLRISGGGAPAASDAGVIIDEVAERRRMGRGIIRQAGGAAGNALRHILARKSH
jgi:hypothetical protein